MAGWVSFVRGDVIDTSSTGIFYGNPNDRDSDHGTTGAVWGYKGLLYDFSRQNNIYGSSNTVTPASLKVGFYIRY